MRCTSGSEGLRRRSSIVRHRRYLWALPLIVLSMLYGKPGWTLQRHTLGGEQPPPGLSAPSTLAPGISTHNEASSHPIAEGSPSAAVHEPATAQQPASQGHVPEAKPQQLPQAATTTPNAHPVGEAPAAAPKIASPLPKGEGELGAPMPSPEGLPEHAEEPGVHVEHGVVLPQISPTPGVTFVETMVNLMEHELSGRTLGWRPNDIIVGRFTDNINNYQLGVLEALRFTTLRLKDSLTRMGDADAYDPDLESALNLLMNRATLFWFPSAEGSYREAVDHLKRFLVKLQNGQRHFYYRSDNLLLLLSTYRDLLGNVNRNLIRQDIGWLDSDDYFYYAKGVAHVYIEILKVVRVGFQNQLALTLDAVAILDELLHELWIAEQVDPWLVLNSGPDSFFANHRANLNAPLSEVAHLLVVLSQL